MVAAGRLTKNELRSTAWQRLFRDVYACTCVPLTHAVRATAACRAVLPGSVVTGRSAAVLWGLDTAGDRDDVELTVPPGRRVSAVRGVRVRRRLLAESAITSRRGVPVTTPLATALALGRDLPAVDAVVALDQMAARRLIDLADVRGAAAAASGPGCRRLRRVVEQADGLAGSPQETRLRLLLHASSLPRPVAQYSVRDHDGLVARVDFGWPEHRVAVEYEGWWHGQAQQVPKDRRRLNRLTAAGWTVIFVTAEDLTDPGQLIGRLAAALGLVH